jgi:Ca2+-binding EF-hand superfamily protein
VSDKIDTNKNGFIEKNEMNAAALELGEIATCEDFEKSFQVMDENHDGKITPKEFINWWKLRRQN